VCATLFHVEFKAKKWGGARKRPRNTQKDPQKKKYLETIGRMFIDENQIPPRSFVKKNQ